MIDCSITERFLAIILGEGWADIPLILQSYDDDHDRMTREAASFKAAGKKYSSPRSATLSGTWGEVKRRAILLAEDGCAIAWTLQEFDGKRQDKPEFFRSIRVVGLDFDHVAALPQFPLSPHAIVESSPGKWHAYWKSQIDRATFERIMACLIARYGADPQAKDVCRVLRLPGFLHQKRDSRKAPSNGHVHLVTLQSIWEGAAYTASEMLSAFEVEAWEQEQQAPKGKPSASGGSTRKQTYPKILPSSRPQNLVDVQQALTHIPAEDRGLWLTVGMALASLKEASARELWDEWSKASEKFDPLDQDMTWDSFRENRDRVDDPKDRVGIGTLFHLARQNGYKPEKAWTWRQHLLLSQRGEPTENLSNLMLIFKNHEAWRGKLWWDTVRGLPMLEDDMLTDLRMGEIAVWLGMNERLPIKNLRLLDTSLRDVCQEHCRDTIQEWLSSLPPWDGQERLTTWLVEICHTPDTDLNRSASRLIPVSMVARALWPGCLYRFVVILEGPESSGKSSLVRALGQEWYINLSMALESKESQMQIQGAWVAELTELDSLSRSEETRIKAFISFTQDDFVPKYSNTRQSHPRRTIFIGTTNEMQYLRGTTGNTRFIPVRTGDEIEVERFIRMRDQLFAEALAYYNAHPEDWWTLQENAFIEVIQEREERRVENVYEEPLRQFLDGRDEIAWEDLALSFLRVESPERWKDKSLQMQIGSALRALGWERRTVWRDGKARKVWLLPQK